LKWDASGSFRYFLDERIACASVGLVARLSIARGSSTTISYYPRNLPFSDQIRADYDFCWVWHFVVFNPYLFRISSRAISRLCLLRHHISRARPPQSLSLLLSPFAPSPRLLPLNHLGDCDCMTLSRQSAPPLARNCDASLFLWPARCLMDASSVVYLFLHARAPSPSHPARPALFLHTADLGSCFSCALSGHR